MYYLALAITTVPPIEASVLMPSDSSYQMWWRIIFQEGALLFLRIKCITRDTFPIFLFMPPTTYLHFPNRWTSTNSKGVLTFARMFRTPEYWSHQVLQHFTSFITFSHSQMPLKADSNLIQFNWNIREIAY